MADEGSGSGPTSVAQRQMQRQSSSSRRKQPKPSDYLKLKPSTALTLSRTWHGCTFELHGTCRLSAASMRLQ